MPIVLAPEERTAEVLKDVSMFLHHNTLVIELVAIFCFELYFCSSFPTTMESGSVCTYGSRSHVLVYDFVSIHIPS